MLRNGKRQRGRAPAEMLRMSLFGAFPIDHDRGGD
jgi:hypothetical protein